MSRGDHSTFISLYLILLFISHLNSSTNILPLYPLSLAVFLNIWKNSSIVWEPYFSCLSSTTFADSLSSPLNFFFSATNNSPANKNSQSPNSKSANTFSFHTSVVSPCTYVKIQCTYSSTDSFLILILIYSLHTITKPAIFPGSPSNNSGLVISSWNLYLDLEAAFSTPLFISYWLPAMLAKQLVIPLVALLEAVTTPLCHVDLFDKMVVKN